MDYYEILGLPRHCSKAAVHKAFRELSKQKHPDRFDEASRPAAEKQYLVIVKAFNTLKDSKLRDKYDKGLGKGGQEAKSPEEWAAGFLKKGILQMERKQYESAVDFFKKAVYYKDTAEANHYLGLAQINIPKHKKDGVTNLQKAVQMDGRNIKYLKALAKAFIDYGLKSRAGVVLERAMEVAPNDPEVLSLSKEINQSKKGGLLDGLFNR